MKKITLLLLSITIFIFLGCYSKKYEEPGRESVRKMPTSITFKIDFQTTWGAVEKVMRRYPLVVKKSSNQGGRIETDWMYGKSDTLYSGFGESRIPYNVRYKITVVARKDQPEVTPITISNREQFLTDIVSDGGNIDGSIYKWRNVESSTRREYQVLRLIEEELKDKLK